MNTDIFSEPELDRWCGHDNEAYAALHEQLHVQPMLEKCCQNSEQKIGPFSAVSASIFARKYAFFSIFLDLQDYRSFAPLDTGNLNKKPFVFRNFQFFAFLAPLVMAVPNVTSFLRRGRRRIRGPLTTLRGGGRAGAGVRAGRIRSRDGKNIKT